MAKIVITESAGILDMVYNEEPGRFKKYSRNLSTGFNVALLQGSGGNPDGGVETSILCQRIVMYSHEMFDTIAGVQITSNSVLFDELRKML